MSTRNKNTGAKKIDFKLELKLADKKRRKSNQSSTSILKPTTIITNSEILSHIKTINGPISVKQGNTSQRIHHHYHHKKELKKFKLKLRPSQRLERVLNNIESISQFYGILVQLMLYFEGFPVQNLFIKCYGESLEDQKSMFIEVFTRFMNQNKQITGSKFHGFVNVADRVIYENYTSNINQFNAELMKQLHEDDNKFNDEMETEFDWKILSKSIRDFDDEMVLKLGIAYGLNENNVMVLHEVDLMRLLEGGKQENVYGEIIHFAHNTAADAKEIWKFCSGIIMRYNYSS